MYMFHLFYKSITCSMVLFLPFAELKPKMVAMPFSDFHLTHILHTVNYFSNKKTTKSLFSDKINKNSDFKRKTSDKLIMSATRGQP